MSTSQIEIKARLAKGLAALATATLLQATASASVPTGASWNGRILSVAAGKLGDEHELAVAAGNAEFVILAEKHNTPPIQQAQARVIESAVASAARTGDFTTAWEFLDFSAKDAVDAAFAVLRSGQIDALEFLKRTQGSTQNSSYAPILEATARLGGELLPVNLSRQQKAPVVKGGIQAADPALVPPGYAKGGAAYYERFAETMAGHASPEQLSNYFDAQCLTDDVMAYHLLESSQRPLRFLVAGSFHADYFDAAVARLRVRAPQARVLLIRFVDASDYTEAELAALAHHARYGDLADFILFVNEPQSP